MTKSQRAQVAELLRCSADGEFSDGLTFLFWASRELDSTWETEHLARLAFQYTCGDGTSRGTALEAALRVEQGWTP